MTSTPSSKLAALEALLFVSGEPLSMKRIASLLDVSPAVAHTLIEGLTKRYSEDAASGLTLITHRDTFELATKKEQAPLLEAFTKSFLQEHLSKAALEVLAIVAYRAPLSRSAIEAIRGVNCSFTLRNLLLRGLIEREENPADVREYAYYPSIALLEKLGIATREDLPDFTRLSQDERLTQLSRSATDEADQLT